MLPHSYDDMRNREQMRMLEPAISVFVEKFRPDRPTLILFPGGMASCLRRADRPYLGEDPGRPFTYTTSWITADIVKTAADLEMHGDLDAGDRITIAQGAANMAGVNSYERFEAWANLYHYNAFIFGWDWRRRVEPLAAFFDQTFLPALQSAVMKAHGGKADPLGNYTIVAHSFGGLMLYTWLSISRGWAKSMAQAVTIGSPLYGYGGQIHRYFGGYAPLNCFYKKSELSRICASMRGGYVLLPMPYAIWQRDRQAFLADDYPLRGYPSVDAHRPDVPADPYDPAEQNGMVRYPTGNWFLANELPVAKAFRMAIAAPLLRPMLGRVHNWRGVQTGASPVVPVAGTCWLQSWQAIKPGFDPDHDADPIADHLGPGDGTIPAWAARLASTPKANVHTFTGNLQHGLLLENDDILWKLRTLIEPAVAGRSSVAELSAALGPAGPVAAQADSAAACKAMQQTPRETAVPPASPVHQEARAVVRRLAADLVKR